MTWTAHLRLRCPPSPLSIASASPVIALRKAVRAVLLADAGLTAALGGPSIFDEAPREASPPYVVYGDSQTRDWSTISDHGTEQFLVIEVWSFQRGLREALDIAARVTALLDDQPLALEGHHLVNLRLVSMETKREANGRFVRASARFRATTEAL